MDNSAWPPGIRPSGRGLRIKIWQRGELKHSEIIQCDPFSKSALKAAINHREQLLSRLRLGLPLFEGDESPNKTVATAAQEYLDMLDAKRNTSITYENILNQYWLPEIGNWPLQEVTSRKIKEILASRKIARKTKKNILIPIKGVFDHEEIEPNPAAGISFKRRQKPKIPRYSPQERTQLMSHLEGQPRVYFALLFACGLRPGEALALKWSDYNGEELDVSKQITRRQLEDSTKTEVSRKVYIPTWARDILNTHTTRFKESWIFLNIKGDHYRDTDVFNQAWQKAHKKARVPYRVPYVCRHSRAAELLSIGILPADASNQLGHSPEMFLRVYSEFIEEYCQVQDKTRFEGVGLVTDKIPTKNQG